MTDKFVDLNLEIQKREADADRQRVFGGIGFVIAISLYYLGNAYDLSTIAYPVAILIALVACFFSWKVLANERAIKRLKNQSA